MTGRLIITARRTAVYEHGADWAINAEWVDGDGNVAMPIPEDDLEEATDAMFAIQGYIAEISATEDGQ